MKEHGELQGPRGRAWPVAASQPVSVTWKVIRVREGDRRPAQKDKLWIVNCKLWIQSLVERARICRRRLIQGGGCVCVWLAQRCESWGAARTKVPVHPSGAVSFREGSPWGAVPVSLNLVSCTQKCGRWFTLAIPGSLLEMQNLKPHLRSADSFCTFSKILRWPTCPSKFEKHWSSRQGQERI